METILVILFLVMEAALAVFTCVKQNKKVQWLRNRMTVEVCELIMLLLLLVISGTVNKGRFLLCIIVLVVRFVITGICFMVKRKNRERVKTKAGAIVGSVIGMVILLLALIPAFVITDYQGLPTSGQYTVKETQAILVDSGRVETFETDGSKREVPVHFYYPETTEANSKFPLVLFSHGAFGYYQSNTSTYRELASNGYVVVSLDHPYHSFFTKDTAGKTITVNPQFVKDAVDATNGVISEEVIFKKSHEWLKLRCEDENFVLNTIEKTQGMKTLDKVWFTEENQYKEEILQAIRQMDLSKIGLMGHSLGGATSVQLGRERKDIDAVINIDGTMFGDEVSYSNGKCVLNNEPYPLPILELCNGAAHLDNKKGEISVNENTMKNAIDGRYIWFQNTEHMDLTDLPLVSPFLAGMLGKGTVDSEQFIPKMNHIILEYYNHYLKGEGELSFQESY